VLKRTGGIEMKLFHIFGIGSKKILEQGYCVKGTVTTVQNSYIYVVKKPVRIGNNGNNSAISHFVCFTYTVEGIAYTGKLFVSPYYNCPVKGEQITVFYDPDKPENYACYSFGRKINLFG
jgi:hypothetical protein